MRVECVRRFKDLEAGTFREVGATFEVSAERFDAINSAGYGRLVQKAEEMPAEAVSEPERAITEDAKPKRRGRPRKTAQPEE